jgi:hypothetical protein
VFGFLEITEMPCRRIINFAILFLFLRYSHFDRYVQKHRRDWNKNETQPKYGRRENHRVHARENRTNWQNWPNVAGREQNNHQNVLNVRFTENG